MPALSLRYDYCALRKPRYLKKSAIESVKLKDTHLVAPFPTTS